MKNCVFNWSGGKDSSFALYRTIQEKRLDVRYLLTTLSESFQRISMHGVREELLDAQCVSLGFQQKKVFLPENASLDIYNERIEEAMKELKAEGINVSVFGDIFLEDLRAYRENQLSKAGFVAEFPLWKMNTTQLAKEFIDAGFKAILVCVDERYLDKNFSGRLYDHQLLADLPDNVDPCGENGEFHTFVFDGPVFRNRIDVVKGDVVYRKYESDKDPHFAAGFWYCDLITN